MSSCVLALAGAAASIIFVVWQLPYHFCGVAAPVSFLWCGSSRIIFVFVATKLVFYNTLIILWRTGICLTLTHNVCNFHYSLISLWTRCSLFCIAIRHIIIIIIHKFSIALFPAEHDWCKTECSSEQPWQVPTLCLNPNRIQSLQGITAQKDPRTRGNVSTVCNSIKTAGKRLSAVKQRMKLYETESCLAQNPQSSWKKTDNGADLTLKKATEVAKVEAYQFSSSRKWNIRVRTRCACSDQAL